MFIFEVKSDEELAAMQVGLTPGIGSYTIKKAEEKTSKNGHPMLEITLQVYDSENKGAEIRDWILSTAVWKISQLCKSIGEEGLYKSGAFNPSDLINKDGGCEIHHQKDDKDILRARIKSYLPPEEKKPENDFKEDEDIAF